MLNFIRRWLFNRSRYVFSYWNGQKIVKADPMVLWRALQQHEDFREDDFKLMKVDALRADIIHKLSGVIRSVFDIAMPNSGGLTELECIDTLITYIAYTNFQKKSGEQTPTLLPPTEPEASPDSTPSPSTQDDLGFT